MEVGRRDREQQGGGSVAVASGTMTGHAVAFIDGFASGNVGWVVLRQDERAGGTDRECDGKQQSTVDRHEAPLSVRWHLHGKILSKSAAVCKRLG